MACMSHDPTPGTRVRGYCVLSPSSCTPHPAFLLGNSSPPSLSVGGMSKNFAFCLHSRANSLRLFTRTSPHSTYVWQKGLNPTSRIKWKSTGRASSYRKGGRQCDLCPTEKLLTLRNINKPNYLNKRSELAFKFWYKATFLLIPPMDRELKNSPTKMQEVGYRECKNTVAVYPVWDHVTYFHISGKGKEWWTEFTSPGAERERVAWNAASTMKSAR